MEDTINYKNDKQLYYRTLELKQNVTSLLFFIKCNILTKCMSFNTYNEWYSPIFIKYTILTWIKMLSDFNGQSIL